MIIMSLMGTKPKWTLGWKNFMPENFPKLNRYFAWTAYCNTITDWPIEQSFFHIRVFFGGKTKSSCFLHALFIHWLIKQITNTYTNHFSRSYENHSSVIMMYVYDMTNVKYMERSFYCWISFIENDSLFDGNSSSSSSFLECLRKMHIIRPWCFQFKLFFLWKQWWRAGRVETNPNSVKHTDE